jgi:hypothetical protein
MTEDRVGKLFVMLFTNGDLPTNPLYLRECWVCGGSVQSHRLAGAYGIAVHSVSGTALGRRGSG